MNDNISREPCSCSFLHGEACDSKSPIEFDSALNEFHIRKNNGYSMIYYCPICGGAAPKSLRDDLFSHISEEEENRLLKLLEPIKSTEELISTFGKPDKERRTFSYKKISETATIYGIEENHIWKGAYFHRKQLKNLKKEAEQDAAANP